MRQKCSRRRVLGIALLLAAFVAPQDSLMAGSDDLLSLQLKRDQVEIAPPVDVSPPKPIARFDRAIGSFGISSGYFDRPLDIAVDADENLFVLDSGNVRIQKFDGNGAYQAHFGETGIREGQFKEPLAMALDNMGNVFVVDTANHRVQKFSASGKFLLQFGTFGSRPGNFNYPVGIAFDPSNTVYVADPKNERLQKFTSGGKFIEEWNRFTVRPAPDISFGGIVALAYDDDRFGYMDALSERDKTVQRFKMDGSPSGSWLVAPPGNCRPVRISIDNDFDMVYILDKGGNRVLRYTKDGVLEGELAGEKTPFKSPSGLVVDRRNNRIYVSDTENNRIQKFYLNQP